MARPPSVPWYYKQWLGDNKVQGMEWEAYGMHFHLINLSIQEEPPGSLPNDMVLIRRWLRSPSDDVWRRVQPQVFSAWTLRGDRWFNSGTVETMERQKRYKERYETGTKKEGDSFPLQEKDSKGDFESQNQPTEGEVFLVERCDQAPEGFDSSALAVGLLGKIGLPSTVANIRVVSAGIELGARELKLSLARATDWHLKQARWHIGEGRKVDRFYFEDGMRRWLGEKPKSSKGSERTDRNQQGIIAALERRYGGTDGSASGDRDGLQRIDRPGERPVAGTPRALPGK